MLGRPARVLLAAWILEREGQAFFQSEATQELARFGETPSAVTQELARFVDWGLLERSGPGQGDRRVYYGQDKTADEWTIWRAAAEAFDLFED